MATENNLYDLSITSVKEACETYLLKKDCTLFINRSNMEDVPLVGLSTPDWEEEFTIEAEHYNGYIQNEYQCMVFARIVLKDKLTALSDSIVVDVTVLCTLKDNTIYFASVHMTNPKRKTLISESEMLSDSTYRKLLECMYDLIIEYKFNDNVFLYNKDKYRQLFHRDTNFINVDQWFWDMCDCVVEEDAENLDIFRSIDTRKRIKNKDYILKTEIRIKRDKDEIIWLRLLFVCLPNQDASSIEKVFILLKDCSAEMAEKMKNIMYARIDSLTQIWNRRYAEELICKNVTSSGKGLFAIFDIDNFKNVNDIFGHMTGDDLLRKISHMVSEKITEEDVFGRLGGDEFVLYLSGDYSERIHNFADIIKSLKFDYHENNTNFKIHCSAGVVAVKNKDLTFSELYEAADKALYAAKGSGKNTYIVNVLEK